MIRYVVVTPARDEEAFLEQTIKAMAAQTILPEAWVIVNDGSGDRTGQIIDRYARTYPWIVPVHRPNRGFREAGRGVIDTFYDGFQRLPCSDWQFLVKLDADLSFQVDYFETCFRSFASEPTLGIGGGAICHEDGGELLVEENPAFHVRGATKIYRRECWDAIGGLIRVAGWDTVDEVKANMLGWQTRTFLDLKLVHYRFTGAADGAWKNAVKNGRANYITGYHPAFMLFKCLRRLARPPYVIGAVGLLWGFLSSYLKRTSQVEDRALIQYTREQQLRRLMLLDSIWK